MRRDLALFPVCWSVGLHKDVNFWVCSVDTEVGHTLLIEIVIRWRCGDKGNWTFIISNWLRGLGKGPDNDSFHAWAWPECWQFESDTCLQTTRLALWWNSSSDTLHSAACPTQKIKKSRRCISSEASHLIAKRYWLTEKTCLIFYKYVYGSESKASSL